MCPWVPELSTDFLREQQEQDRGACQVPHLLLGGREGEKGRDSSPTLGTQPCPQDLLPGCCSYNQVEWVVQAGAVYPV